MLQKTPVYAVVSVLNEESTLSQVLEDLLSVEFLDRLFVIDDGSSDSTPEILASFKGNIHIITNEKNRGKGYSVAQALKLISEGVVLILDADITGFNEDNLSKLAQPVVSESVVFTLGTTRVETYENQNRGISFLIGQRCYRVIDLKPLILKMERSTKYGLEVLLNREFRNRKSKMVLLTGTYHFIKTKKFPFFRAVREYFFELISIMNQLLRLK